MEKSVALQKFVDGKMSPQEFNKLFGEYDTLELREDASGALFRLDGSLYPKERLERLRGSDLNILVLIQKYNPNESSNSTH